MTKLFIEDSSLTAIGDAIRAKTGGTELLSPSGMATAIEGIETGGEIPEERFVFSGDSGYASYNGVWDWFFEDFGNKITTNALTSTVNMFSYSKLESIPFDFNFSTTTTSVSVSSMFFNASKLKNIGDFYNLKPKNISNMFKGCNSLRYLPNFIDCDFTNTNDNCSSLFENCYSLRSIPEDLLKQIRTTASSQYSQLTQSGFALCYALDEIRGVYPSDIKSTSNLFGINCCFRYCCRVKDIIFATQDDGTPYVRNWSNQAIDLTTQVGYGLKGYGGNPCTNYNSGITKDKEVSDDASYAALKNDPDWFASASAYSRYNHDSAVNTINSLPDVSQGTGNTIKFEGKAGANTDGGAINTLTEEEIAVAAAKGWTVTLS